MNLEETLRWLSSSPDYVNLRAIEGVRIELKYGTSDNFMGRNVYGPFTQAFLHRRAAEKLARAAERLKAAHPGHGLLIYDALRPRSVQRVLWNHVAGTPEEGYVANPDRGSMHNYGCAIDLTATAPDGQPLDMGTGFDAFDALSEPRREEEYLRSGRLTEVQHRNRLVLREAMVGAGFIQLPHEWWHYDAFPREEVTRSFAIIE